MSISIHCTLDERRAIDPAFIDRRQNAERYRQEAARLRCDAEMRTNANIVEQLIDVAQRFDELAETIEKMRARQVRR